MVLDMVVRNFVVSRLHMAHRLVQGCVTALDSFTQRYLYDPFAAQGTAQAEQPRNSPGNSPGNEVNRFLKKQQHMQQPR